LVPQLPFPSALSLSRLCMATFFVMVDPVTPLSSAMPSRELRTTRHLPIVVPSVPARAARARIS
jgi:hypothetical protein